MCDATQSTRSYLLPGYLRGSWVVVTGRLTPPNLSSSDFSKNCIEFGIVTNRGKIRIAFYPLADIFVSVLACISQTGEGFLFIPHHSVSAGTIIKSKTIVRIQCKDPLNSPVCLFFLAGKHIRAGH